MTPRPGTVIGVGLLLAVTMVALLAVAQLVDFGAFDLRIAWLNADRRLSVFAVSSLLAQAAMAAVALAQAHLGLERRGAWFTLGGLVGLLVLIRGLAAFNAAVLAVPLACVFALLCVLTRKDRGSRRVVWAGLLLLAVSLLLHKVGLDADSSTASDYTWPYQLLGIVKHGAELAGWIVVATGIAAGITATLTPTIRNRASAMRSIAPCSD